MKIRFQADNDLKQAILKGVVRREPAIDFLSAQAARFDRLADATGALLLPSYRAARARLVCVRAGRSAAAAVEKSWFSLTLRQFSSHAARACENPRGWPSPAPLRPSTPWPRSCNRSESHVGAR